MREAILRPGARDYYELMSDAEQAAIDERAAQLEYDSTPDGIAIFEVPGTPDLFLYDDGTWQMRYRVPDDATIVILGIHHVLDLLPD